MTLEGQVAIITGASEGIGRAIAWAMRSQRAHLVLAARTDAKLEHLARELSDSGFEQRIIWVPTDVTISDQVNALVEAAMETFGQIDILVNNVGRGLRKPFIKTTDEDWHGLLETNLHGTFYASRAVLPHMLSRRQGLIVNIASRVGVVGGAELTAYSAVKHAVVGLTRALSEEYGSLGVRVNAVCPGPVSTDRIKRLLPHLKETDWLSPSDVATAVMFIATSPGHTMQGRTLELF